MQESGRGEAGIRGRSRRTNAAERKFVSHRKCGQQEEKLGFMSMDTLGRETCMSQQGHPRTVTRAKDIENRAGLPSESALAGTPLRF